MRHRPLALALALVVTLLPALPAAAGGIPTTQYVDINDGSCSDATVDSSVNPFCTIQAAVDATNPGDTVEVAAGTYTSAAASVVDIDWTLTINGAGAGSTIVDGQDARVGISTTGGITVTITNLTITGGSGTTGGGISGAGTLNVTNATIANSAATNGGGIGMFNNSSLTLTNVTLDQNSATANGGGVYLPGASGTNALTITGSFFNQNHAGGNGGALSASGSATTTVDIDGSTFTGNDAVTNGGAAFLSGASLTTTIDDSRFTGNGEDHDGGGDDTNNGGAIAASLTTVTISGSQISANLADNGGGVYATTGTVNIKNTTISGNSANTTAGGVYVAAGTIENVTIVENTAGVAEGGLRGTGATPTVRNTIIANNSATFRPDCDAFISAGYNLVEDTTGCTISGDTTGNITGTDPELGPLSGENGGPTDTHAFAPGAPPHNTGNPAAEGSGGDACLATDQRGETRSDFGDCDIGAYELDTYVTRLSGPDRYSTAAAISSAIWPNGSDVVIIANGLNFPDALTGANLYSQQAPLLLVSPSSIPAATSSELDRLDPTTIYVLGGTAVVEESVFTSLGAWGSVTRLSGADRYGTAVAITQEAFSTGVDKVLVANALNFPDALAGGSAAAAVGGALLITDPSSLPTSINDEIVRLSPSTVYLLGGPAAVSDTVLTQLEGIVGGGNVTRISGADRFATAAAISAEFWGSASKVFVATGFNYPDALSGGLAAKGASPVLLITNNSVPTVISDEITRLEATSVFVLGGTAAIDGTAFAALEAIVGL